MATKKPKRGAGRASRKSTTEPFISNDQRPDVATLLESPIKDLTARELQVVFQSLGMSTSPDFDPIEFDEIDEFAGFDEGYFGDASNTQTADIFDFDPAELEAVYLQLETLNIPGADFRSVHPSELMDYAVSLNLPVEVSAVLLNPLKRLIDKGIRDNKGRIDKGIADKARRDKPRIDKALRDKVNRDKSRVDKSIRDAKRAADKQLQDGKSAADKAIRDQKNRKDIADKPRMDKFVRDKDPAKEAKDINETFGVAGAGVGTVTAATDIAALGKRVEALEASFRRIEASLGATSGKKTTRTRKKTVARKKKATSRKSPARKKAATGKKSAKKRS